MAPNINTRASVTGFGNISPLWQKIKLFLPTFEGVLVVFGKNVNLLWQSSCFSANAHRFKMAKYCKN